MRALAFTIALTLLAPTAAHADAFEDGMKIVKDPALLAAKLGEAEAKFREATSAKAPVNVHAHYNLGLLALRKGDPNAAKGQWEKALQLDPKYNPARARLAELDMSNGNAAAARKKLEAIVKGDRYQPEARNALAALDINKKDYEGAIKHARNVLLGDPDNVNAYLNLAIAYFNQGLHDQAGLIASNALDRNPKAGALYNIMGLVYLKRDDTRRATQNFIKALNADPSQLDARLNLATLELAYGDFEKALGRFDEVIKMTKALGRQPSPLLIMTRAVALRGLQKYDDADAGYKEVLQRAASDAKLVTKVHYNRCVLHAQFTEKGQDVAKWQLAREACDTFMKRINRKHPKYREIRKRLKGIASTVKALSKMATP